MKKYDLLILNGTIIDGSGAPRYGSDIGIIGNTIAEIGDLRKADGKEVLNADGSIVAPGFIDVHTHDDWAILSKPAMVPKISQGITTIIAGNCGISLAPLCHSAPPPPLDILAGRGEFKFSTFHDYLTAVEARPPAVNAAFLVGHTTLRLAAMARLDRRASEDEISSMRTLLEEALDAGALGVSTGTFYPPAVHADADEIKKLCTPLGERGGIFATHMRNETNGIIASIEETCDIGSYLGVKTIISHHKIAGMPNWGKSTETLRLIGERKKNLDLGLDCYPYTATSTMIRPERVHMSSRILISWSNPHPEMAGRDLADIAQEWRVSLEEAARKLVPGGATYFTMDEADVQRILRFKDTMIGSDGLPNDSQPHPRLWGTFPRVLGHYSRNLGLFSLEEAVRKMTGLPAKQFGLANRGQIKVGHRADITVFDADEVLDTATFDKPDSPAKGIRMVFTNGQPVWDGKQFIGSFPGEILRYRRKERIAR